ncbi:MAG: SLC13 family permease [Candidatus Bathyarchaeia archaeon]
MKARVLAYATLVFVTSLLAFLVGLNNSQIISITVFSALIYGSLLFWRFRLAFAFIGVTALLALGVLDIPHLIKFAGIDIILFLVGMMIVIGFLEERHFFEYILERIISVVGSDANRLIPVMMLMAALFAALVDEVTSILFMTATMLHLTGKYKVSPTPFIIMLVFATNIGSSATVVGNPIGVMIAMNAGLTFTDFLRWAAPISMLSLFLTIILSTRFFSGDIRKLDECTKLTAKENVKDANDKRLISSNDLKVSWALFLGTILFLVLHHQLEELLHLEKNSMLLGTALAAASISLFLERERARELVERRVDWWTLAFFLFLFASVGTLKYVGITQVLASTLLSVSGGSDIGLLVIFTWVAAILSAFMDNVLAVATFIPIVQDLGMLGSYIFPLWWGMLFGGTFFGNLTMIGSTANIVAIGMLERRKLGHVTLFEWIKPGALVSIPTLILAILLLYVQLPIMPR